MYLKIRTEPTFIIMFPPTLCYAIGEQILHLCIFLVYKDVRNTLDIDIDLDVIYCPAWPSAEPSPGPVA